MKSIRGFVNGGFQAICEVARLADSLAHAQRRREPMAPYGRYRIMDEDLQNRTREELIAEVMRLRDGIRAHRDSSAHDLCWHHPQLWGLLPEPIPKDIAVPAWPQFLRGCIKYRQALDRELPDAPRTDAEFDDTYDRPE